MAVFNQDDFDKLDWRLLRDGAVNLYWNEELLKADLRWLAEREYQVVEFESQKWQSERGFHESVASKLHFPDWYGHNLNALNDCLSDVEISNCGGLVLVFHKFDSFAKSFPKVAQPILDIIETNSRGHMLFGRRLIALIQSENPEISFEPVGACPVKWNPSEWLNKNRGL